MIVVSQKSVGDGDSVSQKYELAALPDVVRVTKKNSTPVSSDTTTEKGGDDKNINPSNRNLSKGKENDVVRTRLQIQTHAHVYTHTHTHTHLENLVSRKTVLVSHLKYKKVILPVQVLVSGKWSLTV